MRNELVDAVMFSINPEPSYYILNGTKDIEVRKMFNIKWAKKQIEKYGGFYGIIYCTKNDKGLVFDEEGKGLVNQELFPYRKGDPERHRLLNGKVVARFWCDKVEEIYFVIYCDSNALETDNIHMSQLLKSSCLTKEELGNYLCPNKEGLFSWGKTYGYAIHISKLEVFDKPKELKEFRVLGNCKKCFVEHNCSNAFKNFCSHKVEKAPQSWCFVEVD